MEFETVELDTGSMPDVFIELYNEIKDLGEIDEYYDFDLAPCDCYYEDVEHDELPFSDYEIDSGLTCMELAMNYYTDGNYDRAIDMITLQAKECTYLGDFGVYDELMFFIKFKLRNLSNKL